MQPPPACFKAYKIRGRVPDDLSPDPARQIGLAYVAEMQPDSVVVGRDMRLESPALPLLRLNNESRSGRETVAEKVAELGPVYTNPIVTVAPERVPIEARGTQFGDSK